jgi:hypothetical protein
MEETPKRKTPKRNIKYLSIPLAPKKPKLKKKEHKNVSNPKIIKQPSEKR